MPVRIVKRSAFSLVELLVAIAILVVLAALLLPTVSCVRAEARRTQCASNLRQVHAAYLAYALNNNDNLPINSYGGDLYWITNLADMERYGLTRGVSDCTDLQVWPTTGGALGSWDQPFVPAGTQIQMVPLGFGNYTYRPGGYASASGVVRVPEGSMYKTMHDPPRMMFGGQTPTPLFTCYAVQEGPVWNVQPTSAQIAEPQPMHGMTGINSLQMGGEVIFKPYPGRQIIDINGDPYIVKFYQMTGDWGGADAMAY